MRSAQPDLTPTPLTTIIPTWLRTTHLNGMQRGIEKESLRMQDNGLLSQQPHPHALGSALTHPHITTDYSESLMELITPPLAHPQAALDFLTQLHVEVAQALPAGETLWPLSMPCMLGGQDDDIPLAQYGSSNIGKLKTLYRRGLGVRYGRRMQTIAGIHYNLSFPETFFKAWQTHEGVTSDETLQDFINTKYFGLIRNFMRLVPMVIYLLGASPAVCACFLKGRQHHLQTLTAGTLYLPNATALRMGNLGYQNSAQRELGIHYNQLNAYIAGIRRAIGTQFQPFVDMGLDDDTGAPLQINGNILQIENEYYSPIRPKQITQSGESPSDALKSRGIAYIELRAIDLDPFTDIGISLDTACFLEVLALYSILLPSPEMSEDEEAMLARNQANVVDHGRQADLQLETLSGSVAFHTWALTHWTAMLAVAAQLDQMGNSQIYQNAMQQMKQRLDSVEQTPSAQVLAGTTAAGGSWQFGHALAQQYAANFSARTLTDHAMRQQMVAASHAQQTTLESENNIEFKDYLAHYR